MEVLGQVKVKCQLSDMPECKFGMNDKLLMEKESKNKKVDRGISINDLKFH
jgi:AP-2 complex subunit mu-1